MREMATKKKRLPIGIDDFVKMRTGNYYYIDKSLFIKELLDSGAAATLVPRPRRFGKTLNISMLHNFFEKTEKSRRYLFDGLAIEQHPDCMVHQGRYPVIFLTLKNVKQMSWDVAYDKMKLAISAEVARHLPAIQSVLTDAERAYVNGLIAGSASQGNFEDALTYLPLYLERAYGEKVIILIDEYDAPIHAGFMHGFYDHMISFMRGFLGGGLKGNNSVEFSVVTGILRVSKESIFSGVNNLRICTIMSDHFADLFGLSEAEVKAVLQAFDLKQNITEVRAWYDGYLFGQTRVYNPWSIFNFIDGGGRLQPYWVNTSDNALIKDMLRRCTPEMKEDLEIVVSGGTVTKTIQENIVMPDIGKNDEILWNFLLFCGYLTFKNYRREETDWLAELFIPNREVGVSYKTAFLSWFSDSTSVRDYTNMLEHLIEGRPAPFQKSFERFCRETLSYFDVKGDEPERFYHALVLGMLASLSKTHDVRSNRESGYGRYDVMLIPKDHSKIGIIIEFKSIDDGLLETAAENALTQLKERGYEVELRAAGITKILKVGIAFKGKESLVLVA